MQALIQVLEEAGGEAGVRLKHLDKKDEKAALQAEQQALDQQLQTEQDPAVEQRGAPHHALDRFIVPLQFLRDVNVRAGAHTSPGRSRR